MQRYINSTKIYICTYCLYVYDIYICKKTMISDFHYKENTGFSYLLAVSKISHFTKIKFQVWCVNRANNFTGKCQNYASACEVSYQLKQIKYYYRDHFEILSIRF